MATLFLRNERNQSVVDIELWVKTEYEYDGSKYKHVEISSGVMIPPYSKLLLENPDQAEEIIFDFEEISELRGWLWEAHEVGKKRDEMDIDDFYKYVYGEVKDYLRKIGKKYKLGVVED